MVNGKCECCLDAAGDGQGLGSGENTFSVAAGEAKGGIVSAVRGEDCFSSEDMVLIGVFASAAAATTTEEAAAAPELTEVLPTAAVVGVALTAEIGLEGAEVAGVVAPAGDTVSATLLSMDFLRLIS